MRSHKAGNAIAAYTVLRGKRRITYKKNITKPTIPRHPHAPCLFLQTYFFALQALFLFSNAGNLPVS